MTDEAVAVEETPEAVEEVQEKVEELVVAEEEAAATPPDLSTERTVPAEEPRPPRKGRDTFLANKEELEKELTKTSSVKDLSAKAGVSYSVLTHWLEYHGLAGPTQEDRAVAKFYKSVELAPDTGCWLWKGKATVRYQGKAMNPRRFAVSVVGGVVDLGRKRLVASCGNPDCVNPEHLVLKVEEEVVAEEPTGQVVPVSDPAPPEESAASAVE